MTPKIKSKVNVRMERNKENESCSTTWVDLNIFWTITPILRKPNFFLYSVSTYLNPNSTQPQFNLNSISTNLRLNLMSTSASISTSTLTSTQYGCDIKATPLVNILNCEIRTLTVVFKNWCSFSSNWGCGLKMIIPVQYHINTKLYYWKEYEQEDFHGLISVL